MIVNEQAEKARLFQRISGVVWVLSVPVCCLVLPWLAVTLRLWPRWNSFLDFYRAIWNGSWHWQGEWHWLVLLAVYFVLLGVPAVATGVHLFSYRGRADLDMEKAEPMGQLCWRLTWFYLGLMVLVLVLAIWPGEYGMAGVTRELDFAEGGVPVGRRELMLAFACWLIWPVSMFLLASLHLRFGAFGGLRWVTRFGMVMGVTVTLVVCCFIWSAS